MTAALLGLVLLAPPDLKSDFQIRYNKIAVAFKKEDVKTLASFHTKDFVDVDTNGDKTKAADFERNMKGSFSVMDVAKISIKVMKVTSKGSTAIVESTFNASGKIVADAKGNKKPFSVITSMRDTWVQAKGGWKLREVRTLKRDLKLAGVKQ